MELIYVLRTHSHGTITLKFNVSLSYELKNHTAVHQIAELWVEFTPVLPEISNTDYLGMKW